MTAAGHQYERLSRGIVKEAQGQVLLLGCPYGLEKMPAIYELSRTRAGEKNLIQKSKGISVVPYGGTYARFARMFLGCLAHVFNQSKGPRSVVAVCPALTDATERVPP